MVDEEEGLVVEEGTGIMMTSSVNEVQITMTVKVKVGWDWHWRASRSKSPFYSPEKRAWADPRPSKKYMRVRLTVSPIFFRCISQKHIA